MRDALDRQWDDISSEQFREYVFADGETIRIVAPLGLHVSDSGSHRVFDGDGVSHYIRPGWLAIKWLAREGYPNFVK